MLLLLGLVLVLVLLVAVLVLVLALVLTLVLELALALVLMQVLGAQLGLLLCRLGANAEVAAGGSNGGATARRLPAANVSVATSQRQRQGTLVTHTPRANTLDF